MPQVWLGLGSNLGDRKQLLRGAIVALDQDGVRIVAVSSLYETAPVGVIEQPDFLNCVVQGETFLEPRELLQACLAIEQSFGRRRSLHWGPRRLDIDLLWYDDRRVHEPDLELPHPRLWERAFVLAPLLELWPDLVSPQRVPARLLLEHALATQSVRRCPISAWWERSEPPS